jgi:hypothetical protein
MVTSFGVGLSVFVEGDIGRKAVSYPKSGSFDLTLGHFVP